MVRLPLKTFNLSCFEWIMNFKLQSDMYWMFSPAEFGVFPSMSFEEGVFGSILVSSIVSRRIVLQSASQYLSPVPKQTTKSTKIWLISQSYNYRLPTKLREGNVFSLVCPSVSNSVHRRFHMIITHEDLTVQGHPNHVPFWTWNLLAQGPPSRPVPLWICDLTVHEPPISDI